jgi:hypothetical protein
MVTDRRPAQFGCADSGPAIVANLLANLRLSRVHKPVGHPTTSPSSQKKQHTRDCDVTSSVLNAARAQADGEEHRGHEESIEGGNPEERDSGKD